MAKYWTVRRLFGVIGTAFIAVHLFSVTNFLYMGDYFALLFDLNPFVNPIIFGLIGYPIFLLLAVISTDWAVAKLKGNWKKIQRLVYFGYWGAVSHFLLSNPPALMNLAGYLLLGLTALTLAGELYWFLKISRQNNYKGLGTKIGIVVILLYLVTLYFGAF